MKTSINPSKKVIPILSVHSSEKFMTMYAAQSIIYPEYLKTGVGLGLVKYEALEHSYITLYP